MDQENQNQDAGPIESDIAQKASQKRKPVFDPTGRIEEINPSEVRIADIRKHFFGLFLIYLQAVLGLLISFGLIFAFLPGVLDTLGLNSTTANLMLYLFALFAGSLGIIFLILATRIYKGNQLILTDQNVTQVLQIGLFHRKISELSMANVEDVTAQQQGIFPTIFNYGILKIETAGEQNNFIFHYCPNPNAYAKAILDARQTFLTTHPEKIHK
jgi:uncharacterized membrane protein YdbT with pleckstrin-like domain